MCWNQRNSGQPWRKHKWGCETSGRPSRCRVRWRWHLDEPQASSNSSLDRRRRYCAFPAFEYYSEVCKEGCRGEILRARYKLKNESSRDLAGTSSSLTQTRKKLFKAALKVKKELNFDFISTSNGRIFLRQTGQLISFNYQRFWSCEADSSTSSCTTRWSRLNIWIQLSALIIFLHCSSFPLSLITLNDSA